MPGSADTQAPQSFTGAFGIIQSQPDERTSVVALEGELDLERAPSLKWALVDSVDAGKQQLIVDLTQVRFMDSTALSVLVGVNRSLSVGSRLAIVCTNSNVLKIFELSGMDGAFAIFPTLDEALGHVRGQTLRIG
ncbi:MAG TPA: STAS domain-containing protein [Solirubrobacteraceae bacterium]|jgi:anti-anti-sigma factor|nr:STAS domain-containing protein [Solirubrobacteraceae bacterium]